MAIAVTRRKVENLAWRGTVSKKLFQDVHLKKQTATEVLAVQVLFSLNTANVVYHIYFRAEPWPLTARRVLAGAGIREVNWSHDIC